MKNIKELAACLYIVIAAFGLTASATSAAVILNVTGGILTGAQNVDVNGTFYDVTFLDGSCNSLFNGCDTNSDLPFFSLSATEVAAASNALLNTVFIDGPFGQFDSNPQLTNGCTTSPCAIVFPLSLASIVAPTEIVIQVVRNFSSTGTDFFEIAQQQNSLDLAQVSGATFAVFALATTSTIPEPGTLVLFGLGLVGLGFVRRKRPVLRINQTSSAYIATAVY